MKTLKQIVDEIDIWEGWQNNYREYVPLFIEEALKGQNWTEWNEDVFTEFFEKSSDQCVSSLKLGYFTGEEKDRIKENWLEIAPILKNIASSQDEAQFESYYELKKIIRKYTNQNRKAATNRLIAGLQPNLLCTIVNEERTISFIKLLNENVENCDISITWDWFKNSNAVLQYYLDNLDSQSVYDNITLPWQTYELLMNDGNKTNEMSEIFEAKDDSTELLKFKKQIILQGPPGTGKTRKAKEIALNMLGLDDHTKLTGNQHFKIIQFHPSYTYEDFVRGIVAESSGENIEYKNVNKTLGLFAAEALKNYLDSKKDIKTISNEMRIEESFEKFKDSLNDQIEEASGYYKLTENVGLITTDDEDAFRYKGKNEGWLKNGNRMLFKDILQAYYDNNTQRQDIKKNNSVSGLARQHASYFIRVVNLFQEFIQKENIQIDANSLDHKIELKNYVLIIDEINRANLSSVLGELIYALEYRGQEVESVYEIKGEGNRLILPPNLYIIGTMNTADRSVGHIDYAIRRRFAFVNVLPEYLENTSEVFFRHGLFEKVSGLFITNISAYKNDNKVKLERASTLSLEFKPEDIWLGHSYFIQRKEIGESGEEFLIPKDFNIRKEYEIKPILLEYVKDGILQGTVKEGDKEISVEQYIYEL